MQNSEFHPEKRCDFGASGQTNMSQTSGWTFPGTAPLQNHPPSHSCDYGGRNHLSRPHPLPWPQMLSHDVWQSFYGNVETKRAPGQDLSRNQSWNISNTRAKGTPVFFTMWILVPSNKFPFFLKLVSIEFQSPIVKSPN